MKASLSAALGRSIAGAPLSIIALCLACSCADARAACTPEQLQQMQQQNLTDAQIRSACVDTGNVAVPGAGGQPAGAAPAPARSRAPRTTDRCYTPAIDCILSDRVRAGSACWCVTPFGPSYGHAR